VFSQHNKQQATSATYRLCWASIYSCRTTRIMICSNSETFKWIDGARFNVQPNTLQQIISGTVFYGSNDPTNSVKALKEDRF